MLPCRGDCSVSHLCLQVVIWSSSSGRGSGLLLLAPSAVSIFLSLSPSYVCLYLALSACPHLSWSGLGWNPSSICGSLSIDHASGSLPLVGVGLVSPLYPTIGVSVLSHPWLTLPHLSLSSLRLPESPFP